MNIGVFGLGTVGSAVLTAMNERREELARICGRPVRVTTVVVRDVKRARGAETGGAAITDDPMAVLDDPDCRIVVELMGGVTMARTVVTEALKRGRAVVTANKRLVAELRADLVRAAGGGGRLFCEAAVGAGIPLLRSVAMLQAGDEILSIEAVINGTSNYILDLMDRGRSRESALARARAEGYAEADPIDDISGRDSACKLSILAGLTMGVNLYPDDIRIRGLAGLEACDIEVARSHDRCIRLVARISRDRDRVRATVGPEILSREHPLAGVRGVDNGVVIRGRNGGRVSLFGPGAGGPATATAVCADIVSAVRGEPGLIDRLRTVVDSPRPRVAAVDAPWYVRHQGGGSVDRFARLLEGAGFRIEQSGITAGRPWAVGRGQVPDHPVLAAPWPEAEQ